MQESIHILDKSYRLERPTDLETLWAEMEDEDLCADERLPYWVEIWPASIFLARWLRQNSQRLRNRWCLDLGCGLGLTTCVASEYTSRVVGMDNELQALSFARHNAGLNRLSSPNWVLMDWRAPGLKKQKFSFIWGADILYETRFFQPLLFLFQELLIPGGTIWLSTPQRQVTESFWRSLEQDHWEIACVDQGFIPYNESRMQVYLFELSKTPSADYHGPGTGH